LNTFSIKVFCPLAFCKRDLSYYRGLIPPEYHTNMAEGEKQPDLNVAESPSQDGERSKSPGLSNGYSTRDLAHRIFKTDDLWLWEITGIIASAGCLFAIIGLLIHLNGHPEPDWGIHTSPRTIKGHNIPGKDVPITLNSVISWLSTVGKICIMIPITKGIGQLKWVWFSERDRQLSDLQRFDDATRGITGSASLIWSLRGR
jgi:hypothetical protein